MDREGILDRYRRLRDIGSRHLEAALGFVSRQAVLEHARRLGLAEGRSLVADAVEDLTLAFDLAIYTAKDGRSRAIDRYARAARLPEGSDERLMLEAMRHARFSIWRMVRRHAAAGLLISDLLRRGDGTWLVDEALEPFADRGGLAFAGRLCEPGGEGFAIATGATVPVDADIMQEVGFDPVLMRHEDPARSAEDPRLAAAIYRAVLTSGMMERPAEA